MSDDLCIKPSMIIASRTFMDAHREAIESMGPRHKTVARWLYDLGWGIDAAALDAFLAPENVRPRVPFSKEIA